MKSKHKIELVYWFMLGLVCFTGAFVGIILAEISLRMF